MPTTYTALGAATSANQEIANSHLGEIVSVLDTPTLEAILEAVTGIATSSNQVSAKAVLDSILAAPATASTASKQDAAAATNGTALTKNKAGGTTSSNASVAVIGDASANDTGSGTTLTATLPSGTIVAQEFAPRMITAAGYEMSDRIEFLTDFPIDLAASEGLVVFLDYTLATQNPTTDRWTAGVTWSES